MKLFFTCPKGIEQLLEQELQALGATETRQTVAGVYAEGDLQLAYTCCLWSRLTNRVLWVMREVNVADADELYEAVQSVDWLEHLRSGGNFCVDFTGKSETIKNTHFGVLKVKDAVVDQIRNKTGNRPDIERQNPDVRINVHLHQEKLVIALDLSGESLHRRGYRKQAGAAPMKENLAAAILLRAGWPNSEWPGLLDPMCGSGTLLVEAAMMSADIAPGLFRNSFGFSRWLGHDTELWKQLKAEAEQRREKGLAGLASKFVGFDQDAQVLERARQNIKRAGLERHISVTQQELARLTCPEDLSSGLLITNPPYGERLGDSEQLLVLYRQLGNALKRSFAGWRAAVFTANPELCKAMRLRADKQYRLFNGALPAQLLMFEVHEQAEPEAEEVVQVSEHAQMFENRLRKNLKQMAKWRKKEQISAYRAYDADIPEYAVAVDVYGDQVMVQEYAPPAKVDRIKAFSRLQEAVVVCAKVFEIKPEEVVLKQRKRQQGSEQYTRHDQSGHFFTIIEHGCVLRVNLQDYLDTGLFLDHRPARYQVQQMAAGKDVLNLFCYTGSATAHAVKGGANSSLSVDMSATYLDWARRNLDLNGANPKQHLLVQEDCFKWLSRPAKPAYDLIFMDPPTFSNSKRMQQVLDVQRDHVWLVNAAMARLRPGGVLIFSNNYRRFKLDYDALAEFDVRDVTAKSLDPDFKRNSKIHVCFEIRHKSN